MTGLLFERCHGGRNLPELCSLYVLHFVWKTWIYEVNVRLIREGHIRVSFLEVETEMKTLQA